MAAKRSAIEAVRCIPKYGIDFYAQVRGSATFAESSSKLEGTVWQIADSCDPGSLTFFLSPAAAMSFSFVQ